MQVFKFKQALSINLIICLTSFFQKLYYKVSDFYLLMHFYYLCACVCESQCTISDEVNLYLECLSINADGPYVVFVGLCYVRNQVASPLNVSHVSFCCSYFNYFRYNECVYKS